MGMGYSPPPPPGMNGGDCHCAKSSAAELSACSTSCWTSSDSSPRFWSTGQSATRGSRVRAYLQVQDEGSSVPASGCRGDDEFPATKVHFCRLFDGDDAVGAPEPSQRVARANVDETSWTRLLRERIAQPEGSSRELSPGEEFAVGRERAPMVVSENDGDNVAVL